MKEYFLKDLITIKNGKDYKHLKDGDIPVYGTGGVMTYVDEYICDNESVLLPRKGSLDNIMYASGKFWTVDTMYWTEVNWEKVYPRYLYYYLSLLDLSSRDSGSTLPSMTFDSYYQLHVNIPSLGEQRKILDILEPIDKKIEINNQINDNLYNQIQSLFEQWFVRFDFPDNSLKPYKTNGGKMKWSEKLKMSIPFDWEVKSLAGLYNITRGISYSSKDIASGNGTAMLNLACIDINRKYRDGELKYYNSTVPMDKHINNGDLLIACTDLTRNADIVGSPILVPSDNIKYTFSMDMVRFEPNESVFNKYFLYIALQQDYYHNYIKRFASGTNVLHLDLSGLDWYTMSIPPKKLQDEFGRIVEQYHLKNGQLLNENRQLISFRNWLLPMLMNGQATIAD